MPDPSPPQSTDPLPDLSLDPAFIAAARLYLPNHHPVCQAEAIEEWLMDQPITTREMGPGVRRDLLDFDGRFPARAPNVDPTNTSKRPVTNPSMDSRPSEKAK
ncbi:hypothetical protein B0H13DRAFT_1904988 [Mycena leptocephala]|nr:hypothetical protein B0H13DRAFT_1904988 [Mycena leptocephala]